MGSGLRPGTTKKQQAMKLLGLQGDEEAPGIKSAFRRLALRYHPDVCHDCGTESDEHFRKLKWAYTLLIKGERAAEGMHDDDEGGLRDHDWDDHDLHWSWKFQNHGKAAPKTHAQQQHQVHSQMANLHERRHARPKRSVVKAMTAEEMATDAEAYDPLALHATHIHAAAAAHAHVEVEVREEVKHDAAYWWGRWDGEAHTPHEAYRTHQQHPHHHRPAHDASKSSTAHAHERLGKQLEGMKRTASIRSQYLGVEEVPVVSVWTVPTRRGLRHEVFKTEASTEEEERFLRLARLAQEWRDHHKSDVKSELEFSDSTFEFVIKREKPSPREALQAAVEGVSLGANA